MLKNKKIALLATITALSLTSCIKDEIDKLKNVNTVQIEDWGAQWAAPLIYSDLSLKNLINDFDDGNIVQSYSDGLLYAVYDSTSYSIQAKDFILIPNSLQGFSLVTTPSQQTTFVSTPIGSDYQIESLAFSDLTYNFGPMEFDQMKVQSGSFEVSFPNTSTHSIKLNLEFPYFIKNGTPLTQNIVLPANSNNPVVINLSGCDIDFTGNTPGQFNKVLVKRSTTFTKENNTPLPPIFNVNLEFKNLVFQSLKGYLGQSVLPAINGTVAIDFFTANLNGGIVTLNDPRLVFKFENQLGMPMSVLGLNPLVATGQNNTTTNITGFPSPYTIQAATNINASWTGKVTMDKNNSNINQATTLKVEKIDYSTQISFNPNGNTGPRNSINANDILKVTCFLEIPMDGTANNFSFQDTFDLDLTGGIDSIDYVKEVLLRFNTTNGIPLNLGMQGVLLNANKMPVAQLFINTPENLIVSATVDNNGNVLNTTNKITDRIIAKPEYKALVQAGVKYIVFKAFASTANNGAANVKIYENQKLNLRLGAKVTMDNNVTIYLKQ